MSKIIKNIPVFFLWLASLAIVAHMIIPHDHHLSESVTSQDESCPASEHQTGHKTGFPIHCHVLHDLTSEKASIFLSIRFAQHNNFVKSSLSDLTFFKIQFPRVYIVDHCELFTDTHLLEFSPFRGPPSICLFS